MPASRTNLSNRRVLLASALVATIAVCVMGRLCLNGFTQWDDNLTISENPHLNPATWQTLVFYWTHFEYRMPPNSAGISLDPAVYHGASVLLHAVSTVLVMRILLQLGMSRIASVMGALIFALHPIQVEAIAWASGLKDALAGMLALASLWKYTQRAVGARAGPAPRSPQVAAIVLFILAMLAKSSAFTVPLAAIAIDRWIIGRPWRTVARSIIPFTIVAAPFVIIAPIAQSAAAELPPVPFAYRPVIALDALTFYLHKLIWPARLCIDYWRNPWAVIKLARLRAFQAEMTIVPAIALIPLAFKRTLPTVWGAGGVFLAGCLPTLGLSVFSMQYYSTTTDHYLYWSMLGPAIAIGRLIDRFNANRWLLTAVSGILFALATMTFHQCGYWHDDVSLMQHACDVNPHSFVACNNLGGDYLNLCDYPKALEMYSKSIDIRHNYAPAHSNRAIALLRLGRLEESTQELRLAIKFQEPEPPQLRYSWTKDLNQLGKNLLQMGQNGEAIAAFQRSLQADPNQPDIVQLLDSARKLQAHPPSTATSP
jgi:tetratricopeptide (TPR) repeat protein